MFTECWAFLSEWIFISFKGTHQIHNIKHPSGPFSQPAAFVPRRNSINSNLTTRLNASHLLHWRNANAAAPLPPPWSNQGIDLRQGSIYPLRAVSDCLPLHLTRPLATKRPQSSWPLRWKCFFSGAIKLEWIWLPIPRGPKRILLVGHKYK